MDQEILDREKQKLDRLENDANTQSVEAGKRKERQKTLWHQIQREAQELLHETEWKKLIPLLKEKQDQCEKQLADSEEEIRIAIERKKKKNETETWIEKLETEIVQLQEEKNQCDRKQAGLQTRDVENKKQQQITAEEIRKLIQKSLVAGNGEVTDNTAAGFERQIQDMLSCLSEKVQGKEKEAKQKQDLEKLIIEREKTLKELGRVINEAAQDIVRLETERKNKAQKVDELNEEIGEGGKESLEQEIKTQRKLYEELKESSRRAQQKLQEIRAEKERITAVVKNFEEQKKEIRAGYDIDIIPSDLATYGRDAKALLKELQSQNERMFLVTFLVLNTGRTEQELENNVFQASSIAQKHNCNLCRLDFQQEQGLMSSLPLADNQIEIQRGLTTSSTAIFIPFTTQELYQSGKESLYYGLNALSNNLIMVDRKKLKNPNGLILGTPGSGKSFSAKREITNAFLVTDDDIIICDPEAEYAPLVERLHGQVIHIGPASTQYINPMDINSNYSEEDNPLALKADFILSLCELVVGGKEGLQPVEKTVIDRCVHVVYRKYFENPTPENMPLLEDLYNALLTQDEPEARHVAAALEIYVKGSLNIFNHHTNVDIHNRIVCFDIKQLGKQLKKLGMLIVQDAVWGRVTANRSAGKSTRYYADEFHLLLKEEQTAAYSVEIWKRFRKWGGIPTALTQNVKDLLASPEVSNIFENSDFVYMLNQANGDRQILAKQLNISPHQLSYVTHSGEGEGLLFFGNVILPFVDRFPTDLELYRIMTTKLGEVSEGAQK